MGSRRHPRPATECNAVSHDNNDELPWKISHQINARHLTWNEDATAQLLSLALQEKLNLSQDEVEDRLQVLATLLPDVKSKLHMTKVQVLSCLIKDTSALAMRLSKLKEILPNCNLSALIAQYPSLVIEWTPEQIKDRIEEMRIQLPGLDAVRLVEAEPYLLKADLPAVIEDIRRLLPGLDPLHVLATSPELVLDMNKSGMESALDVEGYVPRVTR